MAEFPIVVVGKLRWGPNIEGEGIGSADSQNLHATKSTETVLALGALLSGHILRKGENEVRCSRCIQPSSHLTA